MEFNNRVQFLKVVDTFDNDGYKNGTSKELMYTCWARVNKYFSKLDFDSNNLDVTKNLNLTVRYCKMIEILLEESKEVFVCFKKKLYSIKSFDFLKYSKEFVQVIIELNE